MQILVPLIDFIALVVILSILRQRLVYELSGTSLLLSGRTGPGILVYSLLVLPGTIIHELSHWIIAEVLGVKTGQITIFPELADNADSRRLGSVATQKSDPFRGFLIGIAPFVSGLALLGLLGTLLSDGWGIFSWWITSLIVYGIMVIGNSMMISESDRRTWPFIGVFLLIIGIFLSKQSIISLDFLSDPLSTTLKSLNYVLLVTAGLNLVMIVGSYAIRKLIERLTGKRIIHK